MKRHDDPSTVGMAINLVRTAGAIKCKSVADQGGDDFASREVPKQAVVESNRSDDHGYAGFDRDLDLVPWFFRNAFAMLNHALNHQVNDLLYVLERFFMSLAPR